MPLILLVHPAPGMELADGLLALYALTLAGLAFFAVHRVKILWLYFRHCRRQPSAPPPWRGPLPRVCVQCPLFNEPLVAEALLEKVTALRWPAELLEIHILDDSTDGTPGVIERWLRAHPERAGRCVHLRRHSRAGYKAGALAEGMARSQAEFFAVFDADFRPEPDFLEQLMPRFADPDVGVVQARWEFSNRNASLLTRCQGIFLDAHFVVEQAARCSGDLFFNFNGTAGIWRRTALEEAGGWCADTVTEDLDASYRAQLIGWKFVYLDRYTVPSELPENLTAFKSQQRRWTKGGMQVARKLLWTVLMSDRPARVKREAFCHLTVGLIHPLLVMFSILFVPCLYLFGGHPQGIWRWINPLSVVVAGGSTMMLYFTGQYFRKKRWLEGVVWLVGAPFVLAFGLAMSVTCCVATLEGLLTQGGEFVRTPKGGRAASVVGLVGRLRSRTLFMIITFGEIVLGLGMFFGAIYFGGNQMTYIAVILFVKATGFLGLAAMSAPDLLPRFARAARLRREEAVALAAHTG
ncbi:MAG TPA: glycosyltransferase family 2 protein [Opitutaceae bacterium]|nr:glycosyltransferase family 2 protein [Opitutaceae bacterium]